jgi:hypothetical protein
MGSVKSGNKEELNLVAQSEMLSFETPACQDMS